MKKIVMVLFTFFLFFNAAQAVSSTGEAIWVDVRVVLILVGFVFGLLGFITLRNQVKKR
jgi:hypothetical protein